MTRKAMLPIALLTAGASLLLAGCTDSKSQHVTPMQSPSPSASVEVSDEALGEALELIVFRVTDQADTDDHACLVDAVRSAGLSDEALSYLVETGGDDPAALVDGLRDVSEDDVEILYSPQLREKLDVCVEAAVGLSGKDKKKTYSSPEEAAQAATGGKVNLKPAYKVDDADITSASELTDGVVSMFVSFAFDEAQKKTYRAAGECLADHVFDAGLSQKALHFLAGGAPLGKGSVAEHLPDQDQLIWESEAFKIGLMDCTSNA